jgi:hypothetical protein
LRHLIFICTLGAFVGIFLIPLNPVNCTSLRIAWLGCVFSGWAGFTFLVWRGKFWRRVALILPLLAAIPFILPGGKIDADELRMNYVRRLDAFEGTAYYWGGESARGIDCSGLPRRAFRDALLSYGVRHLNGRAFRGFLEQWWYDASAKALGEGYRDYTRPLAVMGTIREMDYKDLLPGDLAVTTSGVHILAYAGDGKWIQADPGIGAVVIMDGRTEENSWFRKSVTTHRWHQLAQPATR